MNYIKQNIVALVALVIAAIAILLILSSANSSINSQLGATTTTPTNYNNLTLSNQLIVGGADLRADTGSATLALTDLLGNTSLIENAATSSTITLTMPSTTTLIAVLPHVGDYVSYMFVNASTTGPSLIIATSTDASVVVKTASGTTATLVAGAVATLDCVKIAVQGKINCLLSPSNP